MAFVTFAGLRPRDADLVARAVLPKFYMERLNAQVYDHLWLPARRKLAVTSAPRVMAKWFLKEYMAADAVVGRELQIVKIGRGCYFTGLLCGPGAGPEVLGLGADGAMADVSVVGASNPLKHLFIPYCKVSTCVLSTVLFSNSRGFYSIVFNYFVLAVLVLLLWLHSFRVRPSTWYLRADC
jgi:glycerol-3-phosphate acyltransferase